MQLATDSHIAHAQTHVASAQKTHPLFEVYKHRLKDAQTHFGDSMYNTASVHTRGATHATDACQHTRTHIQAHENMHIGTVS